MKKSSRIGHYAQTSTAQEVVKAYIPRNLPPEPPLDLGGPLLTLMEEANQALGRLDGASLMLPSIDLFNYMFLRKEALISSQIEGTQSSFSDLLLFESDQAPGVPIADVEEVVNYIAALKYGIKRLDADFPLSLRLIKEIHQILLQGVRGQHKQPGEFRKSQNWIGGSRPGNALFVPPPPEQVLSLMGALEKFLHNDPEHLPPMIKVALAHVQFETIHPFLDGNGRLGRLLITLIFYQERVLMGPSLYLSLYFKQHRSQYYQLLQEVRLKGDWESWLEFFFHAVKETSLQAVSTIKKILNLFEKDKKILMQLGRSAQTTLACFEYFHRHPIASINQLAEQLESTIPTITKALERMLAAGIIKEITGRERNRLFAYEQYIQLISEGADPVRGKAGAVPKQAL